MIQEFRINRMNLRRRLVVAGTLLGVAAPTTFCQTTPSLSSQLLDTASASVFRRVAMRCKDYGLQEFEEEGLLRACVGSLADTQYVSYQTRQGKPLALLLQFYVTGMRLHLVADSVRDSVARQLGDGSSCPISIWTGTVRRVTQWHSGPLTVQLGLDSTFTPGMERARKAPWVGIQVVSSPLQCDHWLGPPDYR